jgi:hypothetical protein
MCVWWRGTREPERKRKLFGVLQNRILIPLGQYLTPMNNLIFSKSPFSKYSHWGKQGFNICI